MEHFLAEKKRNPLAREFCNIYFSLKRSYQRGIVPVLKTDAKKTIFEIWKQEKRLFDIVEKVSDFLNSFLNFFDMRSLQIRGLFFIGPKLDFLSTFEKSPVLKEGGLRSSHKVRFGQIRSKILNYCCRFGFHNTLELSKRDLPSIRIVYKQFAGIPIGFNLWNIWKRADQTEIFRFLGKWICLTTFMVDTSLQGAGMSRVSPEMAFSHRVDIFQKKILSKNIKFQES